MLEGPTTNLWWRRDRTLFTPSLDLGILAGVTRATVLELAGAAGYAVEEGHYGLTELLAADEAFTSSSVREVMPVTELDGAPISRGPAADDLQAADAVVDEDERAAAFEQINQQIMEEYLPGLPISHSPPALVVGPEVEGLTPSPLTAEEFATVSVGGQ